MATRIILCPMCGKDDRMQKVSAAYREGTSAGTISHSDSTLIVSTSLAQRLAPPTRPVAPRVHILWILAIFVPTLLPLIMLFAPMSRRLKLFLILLIVVFLVLMYIVGAIFQNAQGVAVLLGLGVIIFYAAYLLGLNATYLSRRKDYELVEVLAWERMIGKWNKLYYCSRNDCVFDPDNNIVVSITSMNQLLI